jgi:hypothetical protein
VAETIDLAELEPLIACPSSPGNVVPVREVAGREIGQVVIGSSANPGLRDFGIVAQIVDGRYSGDVEFYCYGDQKAVAARTLAAVHGYDLSQCHAYTDSSTDIPLLEAVGNPCAINPDRVLRRLAQQRGWPTLNFTKPVSLRSRLPSGPTSPVALGFWAVLAAAGATWYTMRALKRRVRQQGSYRPAR